MDTTVLSRALLLLLFLHLSPQGARSYPLGDSPERSEKFSGLQELLEQILMQLSQLEVEQLATEPTQQSESTTQETQQTRQTRETQETQETQGTQETTAAPRLRQSQDGTTQTLNKSYSTQMKQKLGCFGHRVDRIGSSGSLGCDGFRRS